MERLTIKELAPYLPYGLKIRNILGRGSTWTLTRFNIEQFSDDDKPLLRNLSQLTEEIEHNGESFVPWVEINKFLNNGEYQPHFNVIEYNEWGSLTISFGDHCAGYSLNLEAIPVIQKLFEWHFDVFGLREKNLALPIDGKEVKS